MRSDPKGADVPVLIITSLNGAENELKGLELGADDFVTKPINMTLLVAKIRRHLHLGGGTESIQPQRNDNEVTNSVKPSNGKGYPAEKAEEELNLRLS